MDACECAHVLNDELNIKGMFQEPQPCGFRGTAVQKYMLYVRYLLLVALLADHLVAVYPSIPHPCLLVVVYRDVTARDNEVCPRSFDMGWAVYTHTRVQFAPLWLRLEQLV